MGRLGLMLALLGSILLSSAAQFLLKLGMSSPAVQGAMADPSMSPARMALTIALSPLIVIGLALFVASAVTWLAVLARLDLSTAYPFVALGIVLTVAAGHFLLGESVSLGKMAGVGMIVGGVVLLGIVSTSSD